MKNKVEMIRKKLKIIVNSHNYNNTKKKSLSWDVKVLGLNTKAFTHMGILQNWSKVRNVLKINYSYKLYNIQSTHNCAVNSHIVFSEIFFSNQMYHYRSNNN